MVDRFGKQARCIIKPRRSSQHDKHVLEEVEAKTEPAGLKPLQEVGEAKAEE